LIAMEDYFDWYGMSDIECVRFAKMKLVVPVRKFWHTLTTQLERMHQPPITQWAVMKDRLKEKYLPSFHRAHLVDQMLNLQQSSSCVLDYINNFEELIQRCELMEDPSITIPRFIHGLRPDLRQDVTLSSPFTLDEAYHKALEVEILNKPMRPPTLPTRPPTQLAPKALQFSASASNTKTFSLPVPSKPSLSSSATASASHNPADNVVQYFSCRGRSHYTS